MKPCTPGAASTTILAIIRAGVFAAASLLGAAGPLAAPALGQPTALPTEPAPTELTLAEKPKWELSVSAMIFFVPDDQEYVQPTVTVDHDWLHLEARYNYEDLDTGSLWVGYNLSGGGELTWELTPMVGGVFGETNGVAPGYEATLGWWKLELYTEGEFVFDADEFSDSYFYSWSELTLSPVDWFRFGLVAQRTRLYESDRDVQFGGLVGFSLDSVDLAAYVLNPDEDDPVFAFSIEVSF